MSLEGKDERLGHRTIPPVSSICPVTEPREKEQVNEDEDEYYDPSYSYSYDYTYTYTYPSDPSLQPEFLRLESEKKNEAFLMMTIIKEIFISCITYHALQFLFLYF
eukprot:Tamp_15771.p2 GENE.Tamp_15771~~Tamp_15771.p2  ORF type:complete len:106 (+),score=3.59 Tamp_15771:1178-1495(+)